MGKAAVIMARLMALALTAALAVAPAASSLTHGPGQIAIEADHAAWHSEQGEDWHANDHSHHDAADHDHSPTVILTVASDIEPPAPRVLWTITQQQASGIIRDGPRRPPRLA